MRTTPVLPGLLLACCVSVACGDDDDAVDYGSAEHDHDAAGSSASGASGHAGASAGAGSKPSGNVREVSCTDESVKQLVLFDKPSTGKIMEEAKLGNAFNTFVDATSGGLTPAQSFVYARFGEDGLMRVDISDEAAFESLDWDIAFRRYLIRLNSGVSGPGDVTATRTQPDTKFESLDSAPDGLEYRTESYFTDSCEFVNDGSGLNSPATALASFWSYSSCLAMTHNVYVIALKEPKERHVKLEVMSYYTPDNQTKCDETGMVPMPTGAGNIRVRWAFLD